jgi:hypothetical protein
MNLILNIYELPEHTAVFKKQSMMQQKVQTGVKDAVFDSDTQY